jgi:hypothetical protein
LWSGALHGLTGMTTSASPGRLPGTLFPVNLEKDWEPRGSLDRQE